MKNWSFRSVRITSIYRVPKNDCPPLPRGNGQCHNIMCDKYRKIYSIKFILANNFKFPARVCYRAGYMKIVEKWLELTKKSPKCSHRLSYSRQKYIYLQKIWKMSTSVTSCNNSINFTSKCMILCVCGCSKSKKLVNFS